MTGHNSSSVPTRPALSGPDENTDDEGYRRPIRAHAGRATTAENQLPVNADQDEADLQPPTAAAPPGLPEEGRGDTFTVPSLPRHGLDRQPDRSGGVTLGDGSLLCPVNHPVPLGINSRTVPNAHKRTKRNRPQRAQTHQKEPSPTRTNAPKGTVPNAHKRTKRNRPQGSGSAEQGRQVQPSQRTAPPGQVAHHRRARRGHRFPVVPDPLGADLAGTEHRRVRLHR